LGDGVTGPEGNAVGACETGDRPTASQVSDFHRGFSGLLEEHSGWLSDVRGAIPPDLQGTFFRNGPGTMEVGGQRYGHWFDGPGMITAVTFRGGNPTFATATCEHPNT